MKKSSALCRKYANGGQVGDPNIKLTDDEIRKLQAAKNDPNDPNAYKKAVQAKIGFTPKKYPAGSQGSKEQAQKYDTAVGLVNNGYRPTSKVVNGKLVTGYKKEDLISLKDDNGYAYGGNVEDMPVTSDVSYSDKKDNSFRFETDPAIVKKLKNNGYNADGTRSKFGGTMSWFNPVYQIKTRLTANKIAKENNDSDTAAVIKASGGEETKLAEGQWLTSFAGAGNTSADIMKSQKSYKTGAKYDSALARLNQENPNLDKKSADTRMQNVTTGLNTAVSIFGAVKGMGKKGGGKSTDPNTPQQLPQDSNVTNQNSLMADGTSMTDDQLYRQSAKDGGKIKGPGTTKSDSIKANVPDGSFVVPAEYADQAMALRKKYFGNPGKKADLKSGDVPVNLSNKEHIFTPEEKAVLESNGVDLNKLAPNAKNKTNMADGGKVGTDDELLAAAEKKKAELAKKKAAEESGKKDEEGAHLNKIITSSLYYHKKDLESKKQKLEKTRETLKQATEHGVASGVFQRGSISIDQAQNDFKNAKKEVDASNKELELKKNPSNWKKNGVDTYGKSKYDFKPGTETPITVGAEKASIGVSKSNSSPVVNKAPVPIKGSALAKKAVTKTATTTTNAEPEKEFNQDLYGMKINNEGAPVTEQNINPGSTELKQTSPATGSINYTNGSAVVDTPNISTQQSALANSKKAKNGTVNGPSTGELLGAGQVAAGAFGLIRQGKRDTYKIGQNVLDDEHQAIENAKFGYSDAEMQLQKRDIESHRIASEKNIINLSNDAGTALANIRSSSIDANHASLELAARDAELKRQKFGMKSAIVNNVENRRRQIFEDKLNKFKENQAATADLLNAGIGNVVGASERRRFNNQVNDAENVNINYGFN